MRSRQSKFVNFMFKNVSKPLQASVPINPVSMKRINRFVKWTSGPFLRRVPSFVTVEKVVSGGTPAEWVISGEQQENRNVLLYIHGGGYVFCAPATHRPITWRLSRDAGVKVLSLDYRMLPDNTLENAWEDTFNAYNWLLDQGYNANNIIIGGDSAGGGLTLQLLFRIREENLPMPCAAFCISPFADMTRSSESLQKNAPNDHLFHVNIIRRMEKYLADHYGEMNPNVSPVFGSFEKLPPLLIQVSDTELLYNDSLLVKERAEAAGCEVRFKEWKDMPHVFSILSNFVPEAKEAVTEIAVFMKEHLSG